MRRTLRCRATKTFVIDTLLLNCYAHQRYSTYNEVRVNANMCTNVVMNRAINTGTPPRLHIFLAQSIACSQIQSQVRYNNYPAPGIFSNNQKLSRPSSYVLASRPFRRDIIDPHDPADGNIFRSALLPTTKS